MREKDTDKNIFIQIFDDDIGKDDFLGDFSYDASSIIENGGVRIKETVSLDNCKTGSVTLSLKFVPKKDMDRKLGELSLIVHGAGNLEKKNKLKKADPYVVCSLGEATFKSNTVKNSSKPVWEHKASFEISSLSPLTLNIEVFDDDIGKDAAIGDSSLDVADLMNNSRVESKASLDNCKTGDIVFSAFFVPSHQDDDNTLSVPTRKGSKAGKSPDIKLLTPVFVGNNFLVVETGEIDLRWFMVILRAFPKSIHKFNISTLRLCLH